jgi:hypothetical protein
MKKYVIKSLRYGAIGLGFLLVLMAALVLTFHAKIQPVPASTNLPLVSIKALTKSLAHEVKARNSSLKLADTADQANGIGYTLTGHSYQILLPVTNNSITFQDNRTETESLSYDRLSAALPTIAGFFRQQNYNRVVSSVQVSTFLTSVLYYQNNENICQVTTYRLLDVTCATLSDVRSAAQQLDPLVALYAAATPGTGSITASFPIIGPSQTAGYALATVHVQSTVGERAVNFYQGNSGPWHMVNLLWYNDPHQNANITPNCEYFESNNEVRSAYAGHACYDSHTYIVRTIRN